MIGFFNYFFWIFTVFLLGVTGAEWAFPGFISFIFPYYWILFAWGLLGIVFVRLTQQKKVAITIPKWVQALLILVGGFLVGEELMHSFSTGIGLIGGWLFGFLLAQFFID